MPPSSNSTTCHSLEEWMGDFYKGYNVDSKGRAWTATCSCSDTVTGAISTCRYDAWRCWSAWQLCTLQTDTYEWLSSFGGMSKSTLTFAYICGRRDSITFEYPNRSFSGSSCKFSLNGQMCTSCEEVEQTRPPEASSTEEPRNLKEGLPFEKEDVPLETNNSEQGIVFGITGSGKGADRGEPSGSSPGATDKAKEEETEWPTGSSPGATVEAEEEETDSSDNPFCNRFDCTNLELGGYFDTCVGGYGFFGTDETSPFYEWFGDSFADEGQVPLDFFPAYPGDISFPVQRLRN